MTSYFYWTALFLKSAYYPFVTSFLGDNCIKIQSRKDLVCDGISPGPRMPCSEKSLTLSPGSQASVIPANSLFPKASGSADMVR